MSKLERTLSIIKPDAVLGGNIEKICDMIRNAGLSIIAQDRLQMSEDEAKVFYNVHKYRPFFNDLVKFMISGVVIVQVLEGEDAVRVYRDLMGDTNSKTAAPGTIRHAYGTDIERNAVHGSDSIENAKTEVAFFFPNL